MSECKTIAICNQKGGVGKTTTAVNLGAGLVRAGRSVLLVLVRVHGLWLRDDGTGHVFMSKGRTKAMRLCPENCIYRNHEARFCGYCLIEIIDDMKKKEDADGIKQNENKDADQAQR